MTHDGLGRIFRVEKKLGRGDLITLVQVFSDGRVSKNSFAHEFYDGLGALREESKNWSGAQVELPLFRLKNSTSLKAIWSGIRGLKEDLSSSVTHWKHLNPDAPYTPDHLAFRILTRETSAHILQYSREQRLSVNTLLLYAINEVIAEQLLAKDQIDCRWLIPINMRRTQEEQQKTNNHTSSIGLRFNRCATPSELESLYRNSLNKWRALSAHALNRTSAYLSEEYLLRLARRRAASNSWIGSFTNLGVWNFPTVSDKNTLWPCAVSIAPPAGTPCFPVGVGIMTWQGHVSMSLRLHSAVISDVTPGPEDLLSDFLKKLTSMTMRPIDVTHSSTK